MKNQIVSKIIKIWLSSQLCDRPIQKLAVVVFLMHITVSALNAQALYTPDASIGNSTTDYVGIGPGLDNPQEMLHVDGNIRGNIAGALRVSTGHGTLDIGAQNTAFCHIYTDRPTIIFNKPIMLYDAGISAYVHSSGYAFDLSFNTNNTRRLLIKGSTGNIGIKTTGDPNYSLDVNGDINFTGNLLQNGTAYSGGNIWTKDAAGNISYTVGNILIGKSTQTNTAYKLDVNGSIRVNEVVVNSTGADFVFSPTYKLRPLSEVASFIKENQHLPEIASARDMQEEGVSVSEIQTKLLQKVEELTLYIIEQQKKLESQQKQIEKIELQNDQLEQKLNH